MIEKEVKDLYFDFNDHKIKRFSNGDNVLVDSENKKFIGLRTIISENIYEGIISYEYAYNLGELYIATFPMIKRLLQKRFRFVFVDEMQDMDQYQHNLLEALFYTKRVIRHVYQRVGDNNQAIYSEEVKRESIWKKREKTLPMTGSHRLSANIAKVVQCFGLKAEIKGLNTYDDGNDNIGIPNIIIFI
jgi:hypothetical protein